MSLVIVGETCPYCTKSRSPQDIHHMPGGAKICAPCRHQHDAALLALSGLKANGDGTFTTSAPPPLMCSECERTPTELKELGQSGNTFSVIYEGGIYRYFCTPCADVYETKRRELFAGTQYAKAKKL